MYFLIFYWSIKLLCISISVLNTSGQCLMFLQVRFPGFECGFYCWLPTWVGKTIVFLYLIKKENCLCEPARAGVGASNPHCFHLYISAPHCMKFVVCLDVTTNLGSTLSAPGIPGIWVLVCVTPKCFFFPSKTKDGGNSIHRQKKTLWQTRARSASEKQPLPIEILLPSQAGRLLNLCAGIQTARGSCAAAAPCRFIGQDQGTFVSLKRWCIVWGTLPQICPDTGNLASVTAFLKLRRAKWGWLRIAWPGLGWWLSRFRLPGEGIGEHADGIPASAFASCPCDLPVVSFNEAEQLGFGFGEDEITLQLPRRQCCKIQAFKSLAQKPWRFGALFTNSVILNF